MPFSFRTTLRNTQVAAIGADIGNAGLLRLYSAAFATLLSEHVCGTPFAASPSNGRLTFNAIADANALADGAATLARFYQADGTTLIVDNLTVTASAGLGDIKLVSGTTCSLGLPVLIDTGYFEAGNL